MLAISSYVQARNNLLSCSGRIYFNKLHQVDEYAKKEVAHALFYLGLNLNFGGVLENLKNCFRPGSNRGPFAC